MSKKNKFVSLRTRLIALLCLSVVVAGAVLLVVNEAGRFLVWRYYLNSDAKSARIERYIDDFQQYVWENQLYVDDSKAIKAWNNGKAADIFAYKDESLMYSASWFKNYDEGSGDSKNPFFNSPWISGERGFEQYLTEDAKMNYLKQLDDILEGNSELTPVIFMDGTLLVTVVDYTEDLLYAAVFVVAVIAALGVLTLIMTLNFTSMATRVNRLATKVKLVEGGDLSMPIKLDGNDELTSLADDVNSMRNSVVDNMTKERQAWEANAALITAMSHDIRTPLTVILGYLDLIELQNEDAANAEYIAACKENTMRLKSLSDDMFSYFLVFGKKELLEEPPARHSVEVIYQMIAEHQILMVEKGYSFDVDLPEQEIFIKTDVNYLGRVVDNIFSNIGKYAETEKPVSIRATVEGEFLKLSFCNVVKKERSESESNNIGIKTCVRIMEQMGGSFVVNNDTEDFAAEMSIPVAEPESESTEAKAV